MSFSQLHGAVRVSVAALALWVATSQSTLADTTTLVCPAITPSWPTLEIDLNEVQGTATVNWDPWLGPGGRPFPAESQGSFAASFNSKSITFDDNRRQRHFEINRLTGTLVLSQGEGLVTHWGCHVGKKQF